MSVNNVLAEDLRRLTVGIEQDLHARVPADSAAEELRAEYETARDYGLTSETWQGWLDAQVSRTATAWVLATAMVRFCEDNGLLDLSFATVSADSADEAFYTARPHASAGDLITHAVDRLRAHPTMALVFDRTSHPLWRMRPSHDACKALLSFWRRRTPDGTLVLDFTDAARSTEFLADLHSAIDERARKAYAQVPTPSFVVSLINDLTLDPAMAEHASDAAGLADFRIIDPACGSGAFLLDAYERLFRRWSETRPEMSPWQRAARALRSLHGCDIDPCAVSVTRFRLLLAAMDSTGERRLDDVPDLPLVVATGDSLLHGRPGTHTGSTPGESGGTADVDEYADRHGLLRPASYHAVTTNPPYITVKDKAMFTAYRDLYESCSGPYTLSVPFTELAFGLALPGERAGHVGLLTSNSFMKREFGRNLIERVLPRVQISHVIDTSGAYIPGHGTPTAVLVGRNRVPDSSVPVHVVVGRRGEPSVPMVPGEGLVWQSLRDLAFQAGAMSEWAESYLQDREQLHVFPWSLTPSAARAVLRRMEAGERLGERVVRIGYAANTGSDDLFCATAHSFGRFGTEESATVPVLTGSEVRDWSAHPGLKAFFPRTEDIREPVDLRQLPGHHRRLWPYRTVLREMRERRGGRKTSPWYDWHQITSGWDMHPWSIVFPWVATHPHFSLLRDPVVPLNSAPVIKLSPSDTEDSHLELLGALNSSAACFWLKQMSQSKGQPRIDQLRGGEAWEKIYEFTSTRLLDLPLPTAFPVVEARELDRLAAESSHVLWELADTNTRITDQLLASAKRRWLSLRSRMIAIQEELDWKVYTHYGLISDSEHLTAAPLEDVPEAALGERAFEIALARRVEAGGARTAWFDRHATAPVTDIPEHWPRAYRDLVERRVNAIQENTSLALLEQPEYKRRWSTPPWDAVVRDILHERLLDHCESSRLWCETSPRGRHPVARTVRELAELLGKDEGFAELAALYAPGAGTAEVLLELLADEHVPQAAPLRYKTSGLRKRQQWEELWEAQRQDDRRGLTDSDVRHPIPPRFTPGDFFRPSYWKRRGKFDIPNERFISFGSSVSPLSPTTPIGWAGWHAHERALVICDLLEADSHAHAHRPESALPLLTAFAEVLPWAAARELAPTTPSDDETLRRTYEKHLTRLGLSTKAVSSWRPPAPRRGRPRKGT